MASSCDGSLATVVIPTSIRVVCANTLHATLHGTESGVRIPHTREFDADSVRARLNVARQQWADYAHLMKSMARKQVSTAEAVRFFELALGGVEANVGESTVFKKRRALQSVQNLYAGAGKGSQLESARGTVWGLINAVTEFVDYGRRTRTEDSRLSSAWFGAGARTKQSALEHALFML
jgi:phage/plasmid-like protein (TIGR03299 family)